MKFTSVMFGIGIGIIITAQVLKFMGIECG